jgi:dihydrofolate synthase/folylpolyglutamate synthase
MIDESPYQATLQYLYHFVDYSLQRNFRNAPGKFDLIRMFALARALGNPQQSYPVIHVAGTKGKGSVSALCASALQAAGYRTGLYTSPHMLDFTERIQVNGHPIPPEDLVTLVEECKPAIAAIPELTWFEITTLLAFLHFARNGAEAAVVEVGLGGRLDATNIVEPVVSVITSLSYDHTALLGDTLSQIAGEKAGIIKPGRPVVLAPQKEEARLVVERVANERQAPLVQVGSDYLFVPLSHSLESQTMFVWSRSEQALADIFFEEGDTHGWAPARLTIPLLGLHQVENTATAYAALQSVRKQGLAITEDAIRAGFSQVVWPGRFEIIHRHPAVILDCAHNRDSALKLRLTLDDYFPGLPVVMVFGASEDKDVLGMFTELLPRVSQLIITHSFHPRAMETEALAAIAHQFGHRVIIVPEVEEALEKALHLANDQDVVLVTGSVFIVAGVRQAWQKRVQKQS